MQVRSARFAGKGPRGMPDLCSGVPKENKEIYYSQPKGIIQDQRAQFTLENSKPARLSRVRQKLQPEGAFFPGLETGLHM
jgi:hypothetical protein